MDLKTSFATLCCLVFWAQTVQAEDHVAGHVVAQFGSPPTVREDAVPQKVQTALSELVTHATGQSSWSPTDSAAFDVIAASGDPRVAWLLTDMLRFTWRPEFGAALTKAATQIMGIELKTIRHRPEIIDHLTAWDIPAYPGYLRHKRAVFTHYVPGWERILVEGEIDWQLVSWGGVNIDARPFGTTDDICDCIPAIDNPEVTSAAEATWLEEDDIVFGLEIGGETRAYPRQIMEVRELVNDTLGGRDLAIPYCTLCGAAQAFFIDGMPPGVARPVMRTSGLLIRSNKVMFDLESYSVFDTFLGKAVTGPLAEMGIKLEQAGVARLPVHEDVIGVTTASGQPVAFARNTAFAALKNGEEIAVENVRLVLDAGGIRAVDAGGAALGSHQAFWFAWSQFHPGTWLWPEIDMDPG